MKYFLLFALLIVYSNIKAFSPLCRMHPADNSFKVKRSFYQSWIISDNERGTDIVLELTRVIKGITFDSLIFRGVKLKAFITPLKKGLQIKGIIPSGKSRIKIDYRVVNLPDQLIYHLNGERKIFPLTTIRREKTKIY